MIMEEYVHVYSELNASKKLCFVNYQNKRLLVILFYQDMLLHSLESSLENDSLEETEPVINTTNRISTQFDMFKYYDSGKSKLDYIVIPGYIENEEWTIGDLEHIVVKMSIKKIKTNEKEYIKRFIKQIGWKETVNFW